MCILGLGAPEAVHYPHVVAHMAILAGSPALATGGGDAPPAPRIQCCSVACSRQGLRLAGFLPWRATRERHLSTTGNVKTGGWRGAAWVGGGEGLARQSPAPNDQ